MTPWTIRWTSRSPRDADRVPVDGALVSSRGRSRDGSAGRARARDAAPLIEVRDVSVRFGGIVALDRVSFDDRARATCSA